MAQAIDGDVAQSHPVDPWTARPFALEGQLGIANPLGTSALAIDISPASWLSVNLGGGLDFDGPQAGVMPRIRFYRFGAEGGSAFFVASGVSVGRLCRSNKIQEGLMECSPADDGDYAYLIRYAVWANAALGYELRSTGGFSLRVGAGVDVLLNPDGGQCFAYGNPNACDHHRTGVEPTFNLAAGYAF